jgi:hypothetical protein
MLHIKRIAAGEYGDVLRNVERTFQKCAAWINDSHNCFQIPSAIARATPVNCGASSAHASPHRVDVALYTQMMFRAATEDEFALLGRECPQFQPAVFASKKCVILIEVRWAIGGKRGNPRDESRDTLDGCLDFDVPCHDVCSLQSFSGDNAQIVPERGAS